jgi:hypothetical protein
MDFLGQKDKRTSTIPMTATMVVVIALISVGTTAIAITIPVQQPAYADNTKNTGATVINDEPCGVGGVGDTTGHLVATPSGNSHLRCHIQDGPSSGENGANPSDISCGVAGAPGTGHLVATPSGNYNLQCHLKE